MVNFILSKTHNGNAKPENISDNESEKVLSRYKIFITSIFFVSSIYIILIGNMIDEY